MSRQLPDRLLARLKAEQSSYALTSLQRPAQKDAFEYGFRSGVVAGYENSINLLISLLKEEQEDDRDI
jgi:hypothetical protein